MEEKVESHRAKVKEVCCEAPDLSLFPNEFVVEVKMVGRQKTELDSAVDS